jgi:hypothetical protein
MCQKASGQPFMAFARVGRNELRWTRGAPAVFRSSTLVERGFCKDCGTPLTYRFEGENISVAIGSFDDPAAVTPIIQYGVEGELPWCATLAALPRKRTDEDMKPEDAARLRSFQHPDHDT